MNLAVTFFANHAATTKREEHIAIEALAARIKKTTRSEKAKLPWLKCARFGNRRTQEGGSLRNNANVIAITGIEADYDAKEMTFEESEERLTEAGINAILYTSPSHTEDEPKWRVLCPLSAEYPPVDRDRFLARLNGLFDGIFAGESWTLSQSYYFGAVNRNPSHRVAVIDGVCIDQADELDARAIGKPEKPKPNGGNGQHHSAARPEDITDARIQGLVTTLLDHVSNAPDGSKHHILFDIGRTLGGYLHLTGWTESEATEHLVGALPSSVKDWDQARKTATAAITIGMQQPLSLADRPNPRAAPPSSNGPGHNAPPPPPPEQEADPAEPEPAPEAADIPQPLLDEPPELPVIICAAGKLDRMYRDAENALLKAKAHVPLYQRTILVKPAVLEYDAANNRKTHSIAMAPVTAPALTKMLSRAAIFMKHDGRKKTRVVCDPPPKLVDIILASRGDWRFPVVRGVLTTPTLRPDGSLLVTPGYDPISRYYLAFPSNLILPEIPEAPTRDEALASLGRLDRLLDGYSFVKDDGVSRSVALAMLMTQVLRCAVPVSPLLAVSATAPGTGKSHLVDLCSHIATGRWCPIMNAGKDDKETEKGINTKLISGVPGFSIDNVHKMLNLEALNTATERPLLSPRQFGTLTDIEIENSVVIYMTGNNLDVVDEQVRRTMLCRMDAGEEQPEQRSFATDPMQTVLKDRGRYIADTLIIARAYITHAKQPAGLKPLGSYPEWSRFVREPLVWLGKADPVLSQKFTHDNDPAAASRRSVIDAWHAAFGLEVHTVRDAIRYATTPPQWEDDPEETFDEAETRLAGHRAHLEHQQQLLAALREAFPAGGRDGINAHAMGNWLRRFEGRLTDGLKFVRAKDASHHHGGALWKLTQ